MVRRTLVGQLVEQLPLGVQKSPVELAEALDVELPSVYAAKNRAVKKLNAVEQPRLFECKEQIVAPRMPDGTSRYELTRDPAKMDDEAIRRERRALSHVKGAKMFAENAKLGRVPGTLEHRQAAERLAAVTEAEHELVTHLAASGD